MIIPNAILAKCNKCKETSVEAIEVKRWHEIAERNCCNKIKCKKDRKAIISRLLLDNRNEKHKLCSLLKKTKRRSDVCREKIKNRSELMFSICRDLFAELWHILGRTDFWYYVRTKAGEYKGDIFFLDVWYDDELDYKMKHYLIETTEKIAPFFYKMTGVQIHIVGTGITCPELQRKKKCTATIPTPKKVLLTP